MGHNRLGELPKSQEWREVIALLDTPNVDAVALVGAVFAAADRRLQLLRNDDVLNYCFWLLTRIASAARTPGFEEQLAQLGILLANDTDAPTFVELVAERIEDRLGDFPPSGHFGDLAQHALRAALADTVGQQGGSLFQCSLADLRDAMARHATAARFGELAFRFFAEFLDRSMQTFVDRELAQHIGEARAFTTVANCQEFQRVLHIHARQSARIVEKFAGGWFSKHHYEERGTISAKSTQGFINVALRKLRDELLLQRESVA